MTLNASLARDSATTQIVHAPGSPIADVIRAARRVAASDANVLITGETGTGKEVFARFLHENSARRARPLVAVNCGAIPEALLESELFGHVRGAFTGAIQSRRGRIAAADGGTLFLDEIGELPLALQVKLLRVLQDRVYEPVGSTESVSADFRLVAATNRDLAAEVEAGRFRQDLYFRLVVCPIEVPPLRERGADVVCLFEQFWAQRGETRPVEPAVLDALRAHRWPGNVRELENLVERLSVCAEGRNIRVTDLPPSLRRFAPAPGAIPEVRPATAAPAPAPEAAPAADDVRPPEAPTLTPIPGALVAETGGLPVPDPRVLGTGAIDLARILRGLEDAYIDAALARTGGNKKAAADLLGLQRTTLVEKLRRRQRDPRPAEGAFHEAGPVTGSHV
jgi:sigma-54 specific flagellar transcriptional regulator A